MSTLTIGSSKNPEKKDKRFVALMRPEDIRESVLNTLDIAVTVDDLRRPTPALVEQLYTAFLQEIFDVDFDEYMVNLQGQPYFSAVSVSWPSLVQGELTRFSPDTIDPRGDVSCDAVSALSQCLVGSYRVHPICQSTGQQSAHTGGTIYVF
jgi:hypothetical protein